MYPEKNCYSLFKFLQCALRPFKPLEIKQAVKILLLSTSYWSLFPIPDVSTFLDKSRKNSCEPAGLK